MADYINTPPVEKLISVTRGCDRWFTVQRVTDDGEPQEFDNNAQVYMWIDIDKAAPTKVEAEIFESIASFIIPDSVTDQVKNGTRFRVVLDIDDLETALLVGRFERHDG